MNKKQVLDISTEKLIKTMVFHGANSAAIMIYQAGKLVHYKSSYEQWQDFYSNDKASLSCHIAQSGIIHAKSHKRFSLIWDDLKPENDASLYLNEQREKYNHCHGISICESLPNDVLFSIILTGRRCDINFAQIVINNKIAVNHELNKFKYRNCLSSPN